MTQITAGSASLLSIVTPNSTGLAPASGFSELIALYSETTQPATSEFSVPSAGAVTSEAQDAASEREQADDAEAQSVAPVSAGDATLTPDIEDVDIFEPLAEGQPPTEVEHHSAPQDDAFIAAPEVPAHTLPSGSMQQVSDLSGAEVLSATAAGNTSFAGMRLASRLASAGAAEAGAHQPVIQAAPATESARVKPPVGAIDSGLQVAETPPPDLKTLHSDPAGRPLELRELLARDVDTSTNGVGVESSPRSREQHLWSLWRDRNIEQRPGAAIQTSQPGQMTVVDSGADGGAEQATVVSMSSDSGVGGDRGAAGHGGTGHGSPQDSPTPRVAFLADGAEKFELAPGSVDVMIGSGEEKATATVAQPRTRAVLSAVREMIVGRSSGPDASGAMQARVELNVDGDSVVVHVRIKDGVVDVDVSGLDAGELARAREELEARLSKGGMSLGDMTQGHERAEDLEPEDLEQASALEDPNAATSDVAGTRAPRHRGDGIWIRA